MSHRSHGLAAALLVPVLLFGAPSRAAEATGAPPPAARPAVKPGAGAPLAAAVSLVPASAAPGALFRIEVEAPGASSAEGTFLRKRIRFFRAGPGRFHAYAAVPLTAEPGAETIAVTLKQPRGKGGNVSAELVVEERTFTEHTLKVAKHFTRPSPEQRRHMKEDGEAFKQAYDVPFGPPQFTDRFLNPREGAKYNSRFGEKRVFNGQTKSRHMGLDLDGRTGDEIRAANDGVVRMVRECFGSGNTVLLNHGAGLFTGYFHLSKFLVKPGETVKRGQLIGLVGSTGRVTGPHLHLSAKAQGVAFDPESLLEFGAPAVAADDKAPATPPQAR